MPPVHKGVLLILDGLGDRPIPSFGGLTPLESARTEVLDTLAATGECGLVDPLSPGVPVDTAIGTGLLLGVPPDSLEGLARGPVEAAGVGMEIHPGDVALRCNFATLERDGGRLRILDRRAGRIRTGTDALAADLLDMDLGDGITATLRPATQHRAVLRLSGQGLSEAITDTDPGVVPLPTPVRQSKARQRGDPRAARTAAAVNRFVEAAYARLEGHAVNLERTARGRPPANGLITRCAGLTTTVRSILERLGLTATVVAGESTVIGLAGLLEMGAVADPRFTGLPDTDIEAKLEAGLRALDHSDVAFVHLKGADICSHDRDPEAKRRFLEAVDGALARIVDQDLVVGVTGDHSSDSSTGNHSGDPVPALLRAPWRRVDACARFGETACGAGGLGRLTATTYLASFLDALGAMPEWRPGGGQYSSGTNLWLE